MSFAGVNFSLFFVSVFFADLFVVSFFFSDLSAMLYSRYMS
ncbi:putative membrane protein [Escherichia coli 2848050]|nr:putative membrane protein [Escherichia coli 2848050]